MGFANAGPILLFLRICHLMSPQMGRVKRPPLAYLIDSARMMDLSQRAFAMSYALLRSHQMSSTHDLICKASSHRFDNSRPSGPVIA